MLFLHEVHEVVGEREEAFERTFRDEFLPDLARGDDARLLYFLHHTHGSGPSYNVVTVTAIRDGAAWERLARRIDGGDLADWAQRVDDLRHDVTAKILLPLPWSPLAPFDLADVPVDGALHDSTLFMEDTVWPFEGKLEAYVAASGSHYASEIGRSDDEGKSLLRIAASFRTAYGSHRRREIVLWQKVVRPQGLLPLLTREVPERFKAAGTWMHDALAVRDRWQSRLLRSARWSPWH